MRDLRITAHIGLYASVAFMRPHSHLANMAATNSHRPPFHDVQQLKHFRCFLRKPAWDVGQTDALADAGSHRQGSVRRPGLKGGRPSRVSAMLERAGALRNYTHTTAAHVNDDHLRRSAALAFGSCLLAGQLAPKPFGAKVLN